MIFREREREREGSLNNSDDDDYYIQSNRTNRESQ